MTDRADQFTITLAQLNPTVGDVEGNAAKARALGRRMDELEDRIATLREQEELDAIRPDLDGAQVMAYLGIPPGREVGEALAHLLEVRMDEGPLAEEEAFRRLDAWWAARAASA